MKKQTISLVAGIAILAVLLVALFMFLPHDFSAKSLYDWFKDNVSYGLVLALMAVESSFIPFPSEIVVPPAAYLAQTNPALGLNPVMLVVFATLGALLGATVNYVLSLLIGRPLVYSFADSRIGHMLLIDRPKVENAEDYFDKHGAISTLLGRLIPAVRQLISIPAGLARMNFAKFAIFTSLGAGIWNAVLAGLGVWLSTWVPEDQLYAQIEANNRYLTWAGFALLALIIAYLAWQGLKKKK